MTVNIYIVRCWYNVLSWKCRHRKTHANGFRKVRQHRNLSDWDRKEQHLKWTYHGERGGSSSPSKSADTGATMYLRKSVGLKFYFEIWNNDSEVWDAELGFPIIAKSILHDMSQLTKKKISSAMLGLWMQLWREKKKGEMLPCASDYKINLNILYYWQKGLLWMKQSAISGWWAEWLSLCMNVCRNVNHKNILKI